MHICNWAQVQKCKKMSETACERSVDLKWSERAPHLQPECLVEVAITQKFVYANAHVRTCAQRIIMSKPNRAADFLQNMQGDTPPAPHQVTDISKRREGRAKAVATTRTGLKHIGGYFDREMVEKVAVLRARLNLDNSELIKLAIEDLHRKHMAKRAFGDA